jgi:hypothetical protein
MLIKNKRGLWYTSVQNPRYFFDAFAAQNFTNLKLRAEKFPSKILRFARDFFPFLSLN